MEKAGAICMKYNGFTLVEVIFAFGLLLMILLSTLPILMKVNLEEADLADKRKAVSILHNELVREINESLTNDKSYSLKDFTVIEITFKSHGELIKGCATWISKQNKRESVCLNGYRET
ncbi:hypothetical protein [Thalassobacillus sp. B23F22_16]|uniref:hypothetical protein n=1 Tax=Thalassobacillus sp. B23F22_16 TaxID=3459513 RepID=UPI00373F29A8